MKKTFKTKKLIGKIYPSKHPLFFFKKEVADGVNPMLNRHAGQQTGRGLIYGDVKKQNGLSHGVVHVDIRALSAMETVGERGVIGNWEQLDAETIFLRFNKDNTVEYNWNLHMQEIKAESRSGNDKSFDEPFGYFIRDQLTEDLDKNIPEDDMPMIDEKKITVKISRDELSKKSDQYIKNNQHIIPVNVKTPQKIKIKIDGKKPGEDVDHQEKIGDNNIPAPTPKTCPIYKNEYTFRNTALHNDHDSSIFDSSGNIRYDSLERRISCMSLTLKKETPRFIFIDRETEERICNGSNPHQNVIGILNGKRYINQGKCFFPYLEIEGIIAAIPVEPFELKWEKQLDQLFAENNKKKRREMVGWFIRFQSETIEDKAKLIKLIKKWHCRNAIDSFCVGVIKSDIIIESERGNIITCDRKKKVFFYRYGYIYSFEKTKDAR